MDRNGKQCNLSCLKPNLTQVSLCGHTQADLRQVWRFRIRNHSNAYSRNNKVRINSIGVSISLKPGSRAAGHFLVLLNQCRLDKHTKHEKARNFMNGLVCL